MFSLSLSQIIRRQTRRKFYIFIVYWKCETFLIFEWNFISTCGRHDLKQKVQKHDIVKWKCTCGFAGSAQKNHMMKNMKFKYCLMQSHKTFQMPQFTQQIRQIQQDILHFCGKNCLIFHLLDICLPVVYSFFKQTNWIRQLIVCINWLLCMMMKAAVYCAVVWCSAVSRSVSGNHMISSHSNENIFSI